jgi:glycerophosphoryl diester phosphodiesterase
MRGKIKFVCLLLFIAQCKKKNNFENIIVIGHAASGLDYLGTLPHDNSKEAIDWALSQYGVDGVEIDVQTSLDSTSWLYHDEKLESQTNGNGCIFELDDQYLKSLHYTTLSKEKIIRLNEIDESHIIAKTLLLDVRHFNYCENKMVDVSIVLNGIKKVNVIKKANTIVLLNNPSWIQSFKNEGYSVLFAVYSIEEARDWYSKNVDGFIVKNGSFDKNHIEEIRTNGKKVFIFDVKSANSIKEAFSKFPDGVITDDILRALTIKENG